MRSGPFNKQAPDSTRVGSPDMFPSSLGLAGWKGLEQKAQDKDTVGLFPARAPAKTMQLPLTERRYLFKSHLY